MYIVISVAFTHKVVWAYMHASGRAGGEGERERERKERVCVCVEREREDSKPCTQQTYTMHTCVHTISLQPKK